MADTFKVGDRVRLRRNIEFGDVQIRKTTKGTIQGISGGRFSKKYEVEWDSPKIKITHVEKDLDSCRVI